jgi:hypothetical protein
MRPCPILAFVTIIKFEFLQVGVFSIAQLLFVMVFATRFEFSYVEVYLNCTIPTYYVSCCNWYGFCCKVWTFTNWGFFPLHRSYLLWFLLHDLNFHKLGFFSIAKLLLMFFVVGCELSYSRVWFCYYSYFLFFYCWVSSLKSHFFQSGNEKISSIMNMHDFAFNFNFLSLVFVGCGSNNNINNLVV